MTYPQRSTYLSPIDADRVIGTALARIVWLKFGVHLPPEPTLAALRTVPSHALDDRGALCSELCWVADKLTTYRWDNYAVGPDDNDVLIKPNDRAVDIAGRWRAAPFADYPGEFQRHYLAHVQVCDDRIPVFAGPDTTQVSLLALCSGNVPAVFLCPMGKETTQIADADTGQTHYQRYAFRLKAIAANWRGDPAARYGSAIPEERVVDASVSEIIGRLEWLLRESAQGLKDTPGVGVVQVGAHRPAGSWGPDLRLMDTLDITITATTHVFREEAEVLQLHGFRTQFQTPQPTGAPRNVGPLYVTEVKRP